MKDLDGVRRNNMKVLMGYAGGTTTGLSEVTKINRSTLSSHLNGREISEKHARQIERAFDKSFGWLDSVHEVEEEPVFDVAVLKATISCIHSTKKIGALYERLGVDGKTDLFNKLYRLFLDPVARNLAPSTLLTLFEGIENEAKSKKTTNRNSRRAR